MQAKANWSSSQTAETGAWRNDGKRPDGLTVVPWPHGKCLVWDFTYTLAIKSPASCCLHSRRWRRGPQTSQPITQRCTISTYRFVPLAAETLLGALGEEAATLFRDTVRRIYATTGEPQSTQFLFECLSIAIQRRNAATAASVVGTAQRLSNCCLDGVLLSPPPRRGH